MSKKTHARRRAKLQGKLDRATQRMHQVGQAARQLTDCARPVLATKDYQFFASELLHALTEHRYQPRDSARWSQLLAQVEAADPNAGAAHRRIVAGLRQVAAIRA